VLTVAESGRVNAVTIEMRPAAPELKACLAVRVRQARFPTSSEGEVRFTFTAVFRVEK
jgi:hypothetical protein